MFPRGPRLMRGAGGAGGPQWHRGWRGEVSTWEGLRFWIQYLQAGGQLVQSPGGGKGSERIDKWLLEHQLCPFKSFSEIWRG